HQVGVSGQQIRSVSHVCLPEAIGIGQQEATEELTHVPVTRAVTCLADGVENVLQTFILLGTQRVLPRTDVGV
ncbi:hypothetical protein, partial [Micrococcus sp. F3Y]|uniref:hypothetical protein n=1 Tax=Micrococcus sp. F3Y TaxID=3402627 RepID=UPI003AF4337A